MRTLLKYKVLRFVISGGICASTQILLVYIFTDLLKIWYIISAIIAFLCSMMIAFVFQKFWTFQNFDRKNSHKQGALFLITGSINIAMNTVIIYILVDKLHIYYIGAQVIASLIIAFFSYMVYTKIFALKEQ